MGEATSAPLFDEAFAHLECRVVGSMEAGDHTVYLGEVISANLERPADILTDLNTPMEYGGLCPTCSEALSRALSLG